APPERRWTDSRKSAASPAPARPQSTGTRPPAHRKRTANEKDDWLWAWSYPHGNAPLFVGVVRGGKRRLYLLKACEREEGARRCHAKVADSAFSKPAPTARSRAARMVGPVDRNGRLERAAAAFRPCADAPAIAPLPSSISCDRAQPRLRKCARPDQCLSF